MSLDFFNPPLLMPYENLRAKTECLGFGGKSIQGTDLDVTEWVAHLGIRVDHSRKGSRIRNETSREIQIKRKKTEKDKQNLKS